MMEYARFGDKIIQREDADHEWVDVPEDDIQDAREKVAVQEGLRDYRRENGAPGLTTQIIRSEDNKAIAEKLGLTADQMAERLAKPDQNQGTKKRISEEEFDSEMAKIGLNPQEARDRFSGKFWANEETTG